MTTGSRLRLDELHPTATLWPDDVPLSASARRARRLARAVHADHTDDRGAPLHRHLERVAAAVPSSARPIAFLHEAPVRSVVPVGEIVRVAGLGVDERRALDLLVPRAGETEEEHTRRIGRAPRSPGRELAALVRLADLRDTTLRASRDGIVAQRTLLAA